MTTKYLTVSLLLLLILSNLGFSQSKTAAQNAKTVKRIENYLSAIEKTGFSGTVLVELGGAKAISKGYGFRNEALKEKNTPQTIFDIGSITKQFTAAAILKLEMQGKLSTDDKISKYFANVPTDKADITIHQILRHSAGLPSVVGGDYEKIGESEFVERVMNTPLKFEAGTRFSYSNVGYSLLALIIEKVSGESYETYLYENLWKPAAMETTGYTRPKFDNDLIATGYRDNAEWGKPTTKEWDKDAPYLHLKGNGGILSTTEDMYKWNRVLLTDQILSKEAKQKYYYPRLREGENDNPYYAYGWDILKTKRNTILTHHNGTNRVFYSDLYRFIDEGITIITLSNKAHQSFTEAAAEISRIIFNPDYAPVIPVAETPANRAFTEELIKLTLEKDLSAATAAYQKKKRGTQLIERLVNVKGYELLEDKKLPQSIEMFKLNVFAFPRSTNAYDSLGEAYLEAGKKDLAIENYKKSLLLNPDNRNAEEVLKRITN